MALSSLFSVRKTRKCEKHRVIIVFVLTIDFSLVLKVLNRNMHEKFLIQFIYVNNVVQKLGFFLKLGYFIQNEVILTYWR